MRASQKVGSCFPVGRHYPGIAAELAALAAKRPQKGLTKVFPASEKWVRAPMAVIDFETTGLDATEHRILEVGVIWVDEGRVTKTFNQMVSPEIPIPEEAMKIHGITEEDLRGEPPFRDILNTLGEMLTGRLPVAYNAPFDRKFLHAELQRNAKYAVRWMEGDKRPPAFDRDVTWVDPLVWARELLSEIRSKKLTEVSAHLGIKLDDAHRATADAEATAAVLLQLAPKMPETYGELIRFQHQLSAEQEAQRSQWRSRRS